MNNHAARGKLSPATGRHLHPITVMDRLRDLGVNLLGAPQPRHRRTRPRVPSLVSEALGYSPQVAFLHAHKAAESTGVARDDVVLRLVEAKSLEEIEEILAIYSPTADEAKAAAAVLNHAAVTDLESAGVLPGAFGNGARPGCAGVD
jgi:hypothetical protein